MILRYRKESYKDTDRPLAQRAAKDLEAFLKPGGFSEKQQAAISIPVKMPHSSIEIRK
jgi:hypothetical protein